MPKLIALALALSLLLPVSALRAPGKDRDEKDNPKPPPGAVWVSAPNTRPREQAEGQRAAYTGPVPHFFTHCLMAYPALALSPQNPMAPHYDADCLTYAEFRSFLAEVYRNGYALVDVDALFTRTANGMAKKKLMFPTNKKPLLLSFDDVVYDRKKSGMGMCDRIALDGAGRLCAETDHPPQGSTVTYDREFVPILEDFIAEHPDFSVDGARAILCLTGYDGILGYRTDRNSPTRQAEIARVRPVVEELRRRGWKFACHGYGHYHMNARTLEQLEGDTAKWQNEVAPLVGSTPLYAYPYGEWDSTPDSRKQKSLEEAGFTFFFGVGARDYFVANAARCFMDRHPLDGISLRKFKDIYAPVFDTDAVYAR